MVDNVTASDGQCGELLPFVLNEILKLVASVFFTGGRGGVGIEKRAVDPDARFSPATAAVYR